MSSLLIQMLKIKPSHIVFYARSLSLFSFACNKTFKTGLVLSSSLIVVSNRFSSSDFTLPPIHLHH